MKTVSLFNYLYLGVVIMKQKVEGLVGPITLLTSRSVAVQVKDLNGVHGANEHDTLDPGSGDSDTI